MQTKQSPTKSSVSLDQPMRQPITYYVIHMAKDVDRVENIDKNQKKLNYPIQNFDGVVGANIDLKNLSNFDNKLVDNFTTDVRKSKYKSIGEVGCYLSHFMLIKSIAESGDRVGYSVIFEDDFTILVDDLQEKIYNSIEAIDNANMDFDMLYLGNLRRRYGQGVTNYSENLTNDVFYPDKTKPIWGTHAYVIKNANVVKLYTKLLDMNLAIDNKYTELVQNNEITVFLLSPTVVDQNTAFISTITGTRIVVGEQLHPSTQKEIVREPFQRKPFVKLTNKELQSKFNETIAIYLSNNPHIVDKNTSPEVEVKFGTRGIKRVTKTDYDNVVSRLISIGFQSNKQEGEYLLRMENQTLDMSSGRFKMSRVRVELEGLPIIRKYCETGTIESVWYNINMTTKNDVIHKNSRVDNVEFEEFNFVLAYKNEQTVNKRGKLGSTIIGEWDNSKKIFRYINRVTYKKPGFPFKIDMSIVKSSSRENRNYKLSTNMLEAGVFTNPESYEIEIEIDNSKLDSPPLTIGMVTPEFLQSSLRKTIKYVLSGLQETSYPISYTEQNEVILKYIDLIHSGKPQPFEKRADSRDFVGPSPVTLLMKNIAPPNKNSNAINVRTGYVVTEKADGSRSLLYIGEKGNIYMITGAMKVIFTGAKTEEKLLFNTLLDGELILHDKHKKFFNTFAAFDVYYVNKEDVRHHYFIASDKEDVSKSRYSMLSNIVSALNPQPVTETELASPIKIICKRFLPLSSDTSIFDACNDILTNIDEGMFEYETDGLIFTPIGLGVGSYEKGSSGKIGRVSWEAAFKWKPPEFNTIDFLVSTIKSPSGQDRITTIHEGGTNTSGGSEENQFKTLILRCGVDEKNDIYLNPCQDIIDDKIPAFIEDTRNSYQPKQFYPTTPYDPDAGICNILLENNGRGDYQMFTKEGEAFDDNVIVEFSYDADSLIKENIWRWIPLRVRHDKTGDLRNGAKEYGNSYRTANSNWESIHNPIKRDMLTSGENIPEEVIDDDVYYNSTTAVTTTQSLRDFHNLFVKKMLIQSIGKQGDTLIDMACGRAGDLPKWVSRNLSFVFGIDVSQQNLENKTNGACARFLNYKKQYKQVPNALFVHGNSSLNIRSGEAMYSEKGAEITRAVFGQGDKNADKLGKGVIRQYAKGASGFNITSCQFAIHYFFENKETFFNFVRNVSECTKINGYFIGTSYDGESLFDRLKTSLPGESISVYASGEKKMWEVTKEYDHDTFDAEDTCFGYKINVFQESINKSFHEFLVNYSYLTRIMANYGFKLISKNEAKSLGFNDGTGMFYDLFNTMMSEIRRDPLKAPEYKSAPDMSANEKSISFLNRYFIYRKVSNENAEKLTEMFLHKDASEVINEDIESRNLAKESKRLELERLERERLATKTTIPSGEPSAPVSKPRVSKLSKKLALVPATETFSTADVDDVSGSVNTVLQDALPVSSQEISNIHNVIDSMYDKDIVLAFYSKSSDAPFPGSGASEKMKDGHKKEYEELHKFLQWRKKLSNFWVAPFELNGHRWNSVEHYYQGSKFKINNPDFYMQFSLDSGSELSKDPLQAKNAGGKDVKHKYRSKNIQIDGDFFASRDKEEMFRAQYSKFTQNEDLMRLLIATKRATLLHIVGRGKANIVFEGLMYIRDMLRPGKK
jgi:GR25 family glycosyltransferase involved in LPS biosynthesis/predicted NAD-dependent protein-ADP-ribosyltransferase YbiA (DUF1768 family)